MFGTNNLPAPLSVGAAAVYPYDAKLQERMVVQSRFGDPIYLYRIQGAGDHKRLLLPRAICPPSLNDLRVGGEDVTFYSIFKPRNDEQARVVEESATRLLNGENFITRAPTGFGKCHGADTPIIMYDGSVKMVQDVKVGDLLMGPDSKPRRVLSTTKGYGPLYKIIPNKGDPFVCNDVHVLSLKSTTSMGSRYKKDEVVNIPLNEYLKKPNTYKHMMKLWRVGVDFDQKPISVDPYFVGLYLGDGSVGVPCITVADSEPEIYEYLVKWAYANDFKVRSEPGNNCKMLYFSLQDRLTGEANWLRRFVERLTVDGEKRIPKRYLRNTREVRLQLIAGLLDSDGHLVKDTVYEIVTKYKGLAEDILFLARSLGFAASCKKVSKGIKSLGFVGEYYRIGISGNTDQIPCKVVRKKAKSREQKKDPLKTGFSVEYIGDGDYYGFTLDGDHLYLLGDFTVTHNTVIAMEVIARVGKKTIVVVTKEDIKDQWVAAAKKILGLTDKEIGIVQGAKMSIKGKKLVIALIQSVSKEGKYQPSMFDSFGLVIWDEVHRVGADTFSNSAWLFKAKLRWGLSATPERKDGKDIVLYAHIGKIKVATDAMLLKPKVLLVYSRWKVPLVQRNGKMVPLPHSPGKTMHINKILANNAKRNGLITDFVLKAYNKGRSIIIFADTKNHLEILQVALRKAGILGKDIAMYVGGLSKKEREAAKVKPVLLATYSFTSEATDIPWLDTMVFATPRSDVVQIVGRILREYPDKKQPVVFDIIDNSSPVFQGYANKRMAWYRKIGAEIKRLGA